MTGDDLQIIQIIIKIVICYKIFFRFSWWNEEIFLKERAIKLNKLA